MMAQLAGCWWLFIVLGVCAGLVSGTLGLGAGVVFVPALVLLCGFEQKSAQGTALAVTVPMTLVGALRYWKNPEIDMSLTIILLIVSGALIGALAGTELAYRLPSLILRKIFAVFLVIVAVRMFITTPGLKQPQAGVNLTSRSTANIIALGDVNNGAKQQ